MNSYSSHLVRKIGLIFLFSVFIVTIFGAARSQEVSDEEAVARENDAKSVVTSLEAISNIIDAQKDKEKTAERLRKAITNAKTEIEKKETGEQLSKVNTELNSLNNQIISLATGVSANELNPIDETFSLREEFEQLLLPFVWILKSTTENARQIEQLNRTLLRASQREQIVKDAISRVRLMIESPGTNKNVTKRLKKILEEWEKKLSAAKDLGTSAEQQLQVRRSKQAEASYTTKKAFTSFFNDRGRNLVHGILGFAAVIILMRMARRVILKLIGTPRNRRLPVRIGALIFDIATAVSAFGTTVAIFNYYNDWLLTGLMLIFILGIGWFGLRSIPSMFEQITLLLNLGAVQEGERLVINGVPWKVKKLDFYSTLENSSLRGGSFTVPVRELKGHHSREVGANEEWFPTEQGDWVVLANGLWAEVVLQSPEAVHLREEGGAISYYPVQSFIEQNPRNLSSGYRVTVEFGLDYSHQNEASVEIPNKLKEYIKSKIADVVDPQNIHELYVTLFRAGTSSLDFEIELDVGPDLGHLYEPIEHALSRYAIECCSINNWQIPFPQLTVHRQAG